jgi:hypothetical protein
VEQAPEQTQEQQERRGNPKWRPGVSANPEGRESKAAYQARVEARARELAAELGGWDRLGTIDRIRLTQAAKLLLDTRHKSVEDTVRYGRLIQCLISSVEARAGRLVDPSEFPW